MESMAELWAHHISLCSNPARPSMSAGKLDVAKTAAELNKLQPMPRPHQPVAAWAMKGVSRAEGERPASLSIQQTPLCPPSCPQSASPAHDSPHMLRDVHLHLPEPAAGSCKAPIALSPTQALAGDAHCSPATGTSITPCPLRLRESCTSASGSA